MSALLAQMSSGLHRISTAVPLIAKNPRAYPREAMIIAITLVLVILIIILVSFAILDVIGDARRKRNLGLRTRRRVRLRSLRYVAIGVALLLSVLTALPWVPAVGRACASCHAVSPAVARWASGRHSDVSCYACHAPDRITGGVSASAEGLARVVLGSRRGSDAAPSAACMRCHRGIRDTITHGTIRIRHREIIDAGMACPDCHVSVGHEGSVASTRRVVRASSTRADASVESTLASLSPSTMSRCLICHDGRKAFATCDRCHTKAILDAASLPRTPGTTKVKIVCVGCHREATSKKCVACHGLEMPHPDSFLGKHAATSNSNPELCKRCHAEATAGACSCHDPGSQHGAYGEWFPRHGRMASASGPSGCNCHNMGFCYFCHDVNPF